MSPIQRRDHLLIACALLLVVAVGAFALAPRSHAAALPAGVAEQRFTAHGSAGASPVTAISVSLGDSRYRVQPMLTHGKLLSQLNVVAVIDGDFYNLQTGRPSGRFVIDGAASGAIAEPSLVLSPGPVAITRYARAIDTSVISGKPRLLVDGDTATTYEADGATSDQIDAVVPRSAVALDAGRLYLVACGEPGLTMAEWATTLQARGYTDALNLDGGPSTGLVAEHQLVIGQDAKVPTALVIVRR